MKKLFSISFLFFFLLFYTYAWGQTIFNVTKYGAIGDGRADEAKAFLTCINDAIKVNGIVLIPYGKYRIDTTIQFNLEDHSVQLKGIVSKGRKPIIFSNKFIDIIKAVSNVNSPNGSLEVTNLRIIGNNIPYTANHPYYDGNYYRSGIVAYNLKSVTISNNIISDIYGDGINVRNLKGEKSDLNNRASVKISDNKVLNCWGLNPTIEKNVPNYKLIDEYGDGIYISNAIDGLIENNEIINDLDKTRQFGRAGIVLEYNAENFTIENNTINGYDRNIHLEKDLGGHEIINNRLTGSDIGVFVFDNSPDDKAKAIEIVSNYISNENVPDFLQYPAIRGKGERSLISIMSKGSSRAGTVIKSNKLYVFKNFKYNGNTVERIYAENVDLEGNIYKAVGFGLTDNILKRPYIYLDKNLKARTNETYDGLMLRFNAKLAAPTDRIGESGNKFLNNAKSNF